MMLMYGQILHIQARVFIDLLSLAGSEIRILDKGSRNHPLCAAATERNSIRSQTLVLARIENIWLFCHNNGRSINKKIGLKKNKAWWSIKILTFNQLMGTTKNWRKPEKHNGRSLSSK